MSWGNEWRQGGVVKLDLAEELAKHLGKVRDTLAAVLPDDNNKLAADLNRLPARTLLSLLDVVSVLEKQERELFEAFSEWTHKDAGGDTLMNTIPSRFGYREWLNGRTKETIGSMMFRCNGKENDAK